MRKGFVSVSILIISALGAVLIGGGTFAAYKYTEVVRESQKQEAELVALKDQEIENLKNQLTTNAQPEAASSTELYETPVEDIEVQESAGETEVREVVRVVTEYVPIEVPSTPAVESDSSLVNTDAEVAKTEESIAEPVEAPDILDTDVKFEISNIRQTAFADEYGGVYGSFEVELLVTAPKDFDVFIPQTTTNTIGASIIGFSYTINGNNFRGVEDSKVTCAVRTGNNCKIKAGNSSKIVTTIWLYPDSESNGNYSVRFDDVNYYIDDERKTFDIDRTTARINLMY